MVGFNSGPRKTKSLLTKEEYLEFEKWERLLQKSLSLEAEKGFCNILGRKEFFNIFISRKLKDIPKGLDSSLIQKFHDYHLKFKIYNECDIKKRRRLVIDLRQLLRTSYLKYQLPSVLTPPKLNISNDVYTIDNKRDLTISLKSNVGEIPGVGDKINSILVSSNINIVEDLIYRFPKNYVDYSSLKRINELTPGETVTFVASIKRCSSFISPKNRNLAILNVLVVDITGEIKISKFYVGKRFSSRYFLKSQEKSLPVGSKVAVSGLVKENGFGLSIHDPIIEIICNSKSNLKSSKIGRLTPIYLNINGLNSDRYRSILKSVLPLSDKIVDPLPTEIIKRHDFPAKSKALRNIHFPGSKDELEKAKRRLIFDEFLLFQLNLLLKRNQYKNRSSPLFHISSEKNHLSQKFINLLPFPLTVAQKRVINEIKIDLKKTEPMSRLLQGDVGSGKTIVAIVSLLDAVSSGWQGAFMAPTEVLAEQHYRNLCQWLPSLHVTVELLTGSTPQSRRRNLLKDLSNGSIKILVGTHALIEDPVVFSRLGLVIVDEQHRFGVKQRNLLLDKGLQPHLLTMTATPIPRTLALSIHGDLDVSNLDELPPGRTPVDTKLFTYSKIFKVYDLVRERIIKGQQAYIVVPLVEESEKLDLNSAKCVYDDLSKNIFPNFKIGLLHGKMKSEEKNTVLKGFLSNEINILVSTTVIEVGVDVPNATIMVIEDASRFGLSQLHQLRGRVGRGSISSSCILIYDGKQNNSKNRLEILSKTTDGFEISELDLKLRGPGQFLGTKQSGLPDFALGSIINDSNILELARKESLSLINLDPELKNNHNLRSWIRTYGKNLNQNSQLN